MTGPEGWRGRLTHRFFDISVIGKGIDGLLEVAGGALLLFANPMQIHHLIRDLTQHELSEDPRDVVATYLRNSVHDLSTGTKAFAASYLLWHGVVKIVLVAALLQGRRRAYPVAIVAFTLFLLYQLYRYTHTHAAELLILSLLDIIVIALTWLEYRRLDFGDRHGRS